MMHRPITTAMICFFLFLFLFHSAKYNVFIGNDYSKRDILKSVALKLGAPGLSFFLRNKTLSFIKSCDHDHVTQIFHDFFRIDYLF